LSLGKGDEVRGYFGKEGKGCVVWSAELLSAAVAAAAFVVAIPLCRRKYSIFNFHFAGQQKLASENKGREWRAE